MPCVHRKDTTISQLYKQPCDFCTPKHAPKDFYKKRNGREKEQPYYGKIKDIPPGYYLPFVGWHLEGKYNLNFQPLNFHVDFSH